VTITRFLCGSALLGVFSTSTAFRLSPSSFYLPMNRFALFLLPTAAFAAAFVPWSDVPEVRPKAATPLPLARWEVAFERGGDIWIANGDGSNQRVLIKTGHSPAWSPDGSQLAFVRGNRLMISEADGSRLRVVFTGQAPEGAGSDPRFDQDSMAASWNPATHDLVWSDMVGHGAGIFYRRFDGRRGPIDDLQPGDKGTGYQFQWSSNPQWSPSGR
jgi:dipeptidyl aminopeptidase/acylaminoacyl peptidase